MQARADQAGALERVLHERLTDPEVGRLLDALAPWGVRHLAMPASPARVWAAIAAARAQG